MLLRLRKNSKIDFENTISLLFLQKNVQDLKGLRENNPVHKNEDVFIHTKIVTLRLNNLLSFSFIKSSDTKNAAIKHFKRAIERFSKAELLVLSGVLHDIGKAKFIKIDNKQVRVLKEKCDGTTEAIGHETMSAKYSEKILKSLGFLKKERDYMTELIKVHNGFFMSDFATWYKLPSKKVIAEQKRKCPNILVEVLFFMLTDNKDAPSFLKAQSYILNKILQQAEVYD